MCHFFGSAIFENTAEQLWVSDVADQFPEITHFNIEKTFEKDIGLSFRIVASLNEAAYRRPKFDIWLVHGYFRSRRMKLFLFRWLQKNVTLKIFPQKFLPRRAQLLHYMSSYQFVIVFHWFLWRSIPKCFYRQSSSIDRSMRS